MLVKRKSKYGDRTPEQIILDERTRTRNWKMMMRNAALAHLGGVCVRCGYDDPRALQIDHVHGNEAIARKSGINGGKMFRDVLNTTPGYRYQLLCANCNTIKRVENGEHSHAKKGKRQRFHLVPAKRKRPYRSYSTRHVLRHANLA